MQFITRYTFTDNDDSGYLSQSENAYECNIDETVWLDSWMAALLAALDAHVDQSTTSGRYNAEVSISVFNDSSEVRVFFCKIRIRDGQWYVLHTSGRDDLAKYVMDGLTADTTPVPP